MPVGLVQSGHHHLIECNLFSPWYSWKIAHLALNNKHSLTRTSDTKKTVFHKIGSLQKCNVFSRKFTISSMLTLLCYLLSVCLTENHAISPKNIFLSRLAPPLSRPFPPKPRPDIFHIFVQMSYKGNQHIYPIWENTVIYN